MKVGQVGDGSSRTRLSHRPSVGKTNANADALSRCPLPTSSDSHPTAEVVAAITGAERDDEDQSIKDLATLQQADETLQPFIEYLATGVLPQEDRLARRVALTSSQYTILDRILYHIADDSALWIVPPSSTRRELFDEVHGGRFGAHLSDLKVYSELRKHYWWEGMRRDVNNWTRACLICATYHVRRKVKPPLPPLPVSGTFDGVGVDVPKTRRGNRYAVVFVDYLTKWPEVPDPTSANIARLLIEEVISRH